MAIFLEWLTESLITVPSTRSEHTTMAEKVQMAGGVPEFRQLVDDYREKSGDEYDIDEDPLFMDIEKFRNTYSG